MSIIGNNSFLRDRFDFFCDEVLCCSNVLDDLTIETGVLFLYSQRLPEVAFEVQKPPQNEQKKQSPTQNSRKIGVESEKSPLKGKWAQQVRVDCAPFFWRARASASGRLREIAIDFSRASRRPRPGCFPFPVLRPCALGSLASAPPPASLHRLFNGNIIHRRPTVATRRAPKIASVNYNNTTNGRDIPLLSWMAFRVHHVTSVGHTHFCLNGLAEDVSSPVTSDERDRERALVRDKERCRKKHMSATEKVIRLWRLTKIDLIWSKGLTILPQQSRAATVARHHSLFADWQGKSETAKLSK